MEEKKDIIHHLSRIIHNQNVLMQAAIIAAHHNGPEAGLKWIYNELWQLDLLPDENDQWFGDANDYYRANCSDPLGPCEICGRPSGASGSGHIACGFDHLQKAKEAKLIK